MCDYPILAVSYGFKENGKRHLKLLPKRFDLSFEQARDKYGDFLVLLPCGHCPSCMRSYAKTWSTRCMLESLYHEDSCFITLTYDPEHLPKDGKLKKRDLQLFFKRLRFKTGKSIRYFACGEYGELGNRPHYHAILFGINFTDGELWTKNELGQPSYDSPLLSSIWQNGLVNVGTVTKESCSYVARYSLKKQTSDIKDDSFILMSLKPAIGAQFYLDNRQLLYLSNKIYAPGLHGEPIPRIFDKYAENDPLVKSIFEDAKQYRLERHRMTLYSDMIQYGCRTLEEANNKNIARHSKRMKLLRRTI